MSECTSEKVDIYVTNSRYKNVQTIYDYFKITAVNMTISNVQN